MARNRKPALRHPPDSVRAHRRKTPDFRDKTALNPGTLLAPLPAVFVGCARPDGTGANLITVAWAGVVNSDPPMVSVSLRPERHSHALVCASGAFTVNLPSRALAEALDRCGVVSGRDHDKFVLCGLTVEPPVADGDAPGLAEAPVILSCRVTEARPLGSHTMFLGRVTAVRAARVLMDPDGRLALERAGLVAFAHGHYYEIGDGIGHFGWSVRK